LDRRIRTEYLLTAAKKLGGFAIKEALDRISLAINLLLEGGGSRRLDLGGMFAHALVLRLFPNVTSTISFVSEQPSLIHSISPSACEQSAN
jgi:hypothetical protein